MVPTPARPRELLIGTATEYVDWLEQVEAAIGEQFDIEAARRIFGRMEAERPDEYAQMMQEVLRLLGPPVPPAQPAE